MGRRIKPWLCLFSRFRGPAAKAKSTQDVATRPAIPEGSSTHVITVPSNHHHIHSNDVLPSNAMTEPGNQGDQGSPVGSTHSNSASSDSGSSPVHSAVNGQFLL